MLHVLLDAWVYERALVLSLTLLIPTGTLADSLQAEGKYPPRVRAMYGSYPGPSAVGVRGQTQLG